MRPSFTVPPVPQRCLSLAASSSTPFSSNGTSKTVCHAFTTPPCRLSADLEGDRFLGRFLDWRTRQFGFLLWVFPPLATTEKPSHQAHDLPLDQSQDFWSIVNVPKLDLFSKRR